MQIDHAMRYFHALVRQSVSDVTTNVAWSRFQGQTTYPWIGLQVITGPDTTRVQRTQAQRKSVEITVLVGAMADPVAVVVGGRYLAVAHTGTASTTATALDALTPPHWTTTVVGAVLTITGPDVFGGQAYFGVEVENTDVGDLLWVNCHRRDVQIQTDVWTQVDHSGRPTRWDPTGCDTLALRIRDRLWDAEVNDPWRILVRPSDVMRPFDESYPDGREYFRASFDSRVSWLDVVAERRYDGETSILEETSGTIETSADGTMYVIEDFSIDENLDP